MSAVLCPFDLIADIYEHAAVACTIIVIGDDYNIGNA